MAAPTLSAQTTKTTSIARLVLTITTSLHCLSASVEAFLSSPTRVTFRKNIAFWGQKTDAIPYQSINCNVIRSPPLTVLYSTIGPGDEYDDNENEIFDPDFSETPEDIEEIEEEEDDEDVEGDTYTFGDASVETAVEGNEEKGEGSSGGEGVGKKERTGGLRDSSPFDPRMGHGMSTLEYEKFMAKEREADEMESAMETIDESELIQESLEYPTEHVRLGDVDGCDAPSDADWRISAELIMTSAATSVGATVEGFTWSMARVTVTVSTTEGVTPLPWENDPAEWDGIDDHIYPKDALDIGTIHSDKIEEEDWDEDTHELSDEHRSKEPVDLNGITTVARVIIAALDEAGGEDILERHHIEVSTPGASDELTTQRQFDAYKGFDVTVQTKDPWGSNRKLEGKLVERGTMDLKINMKGRIVKVPVALVESVRLPKAKAEKW